MNEIGIGTIVFDNWKVVESIGQGSYGTVYKIQREQIYDNSLKREDQYAALKVIYVPKEKSEVDCLRNMGMDSNKIQTYFEDVAERIGQEIDVMYSLKGHSNIVSYEAFDILHQESKIGFVIMIRMELLTTINDYARTHKMDEKRIIQLGIDLCQALEACEQQKILHRDIKPENIFVSNFGSFKLGDFGIARITDGTDTGTSIGTFPYMAPEVLDRKKYNSTIDIYSLGVVLYKYLNKGRFPFMPEHGRGFTTKDVKTAVEMRLSGKDVPPIKGINPELSAIVCKACDYHSEARYQSARELKNALLEYQRKAGQKNNTDDTESVKGDENTNLEYGRTICEERPDFKNTVLEDLERTVIISDKEAEQQQSVQKMGESPEPSEKKSITHNHSVNVKDDGPKKNNEEVNRAERKSGKKNRRKLSYVMAVGVAAVVIILGAIYALTRNTYQPEIGDIVTFGVYEQDGNPDNGAEDIEWMILDVQDHKALLFSKEGLDAKAYNEAYVNISWENCTLRQWLNNDFLNTAFSPEEQKSIVQTAMVNDDNPKYGTEGGNDTNDYIFCLSQKEAELYFQSDADRIGNPTDYAVNQGAWMSGNGVCWWWLRSPGDNANYAVYVNRDGIIRSCGYDVRDDTGSVRPAMWVNTKSLESSNRQSKVQ